METENPASKSDAGGNLFTLRLLSGIFLLSIFIYMGLIYSGRLAKPVGKMSSNQSLAIILLCVGASEIALAKPLANMLRRSATKSRNENSAVTKKESSVIFSSSLVFLAVNEAGALVGFVASLVSGSPLPCYLLGTLAILSILQNWPSRSLFQED